MLSAALMGVNEREMARSQRALVDACFEEGQYEAGISLLQQLRSPKYKPSPSHVRQLLYIALYPPLEKGKEKAKHDFGTPSKVPSVKQKKSPHVPTPAASEAALQCLTSLVTTNRPESLARALPSYPPAKDHSVQVIDIIEEAEDSFISREAANIKQCKNCWAILKEGFIQRTDGDPSLNSARSRPRRRATCDDDMLDCDSMYTDAPAFVGQYAWPVLEWLVEVFERDENLTEITGLPRYSPLLLCQIPPARTGVGARWEADTPLDIVFHCLDQPEPSRKSVGARLMSLLVNLTSVMYFDAALFTNATFARLIAKGSLSLPDFLSILPASLVAAKFRFALCRKYLAGSSGDSVQTVITGSKPQGRIQPRARRRGDLTEGEATLQPKAVESERTREAVASRLPLPPSAEVLHLLQVTRTDPKDRTADEEQKVKFDFVMTYGKLQNEIPLDERDANWPCVLQDGTLRRSLDTALRSKPGDMKEQITTGQYMRDLISRMLGAW